MNLLRLLVLLVSLPLLLGGCGGEKHEGVNANEELVHDYRGVDGIVMAYFKGSRDSLHR